MAFATFLALSLSCAGGALTLVTADNVWAKEHAWLIPYLWVATSIFLACALASARWFRGLFVSQEAFSARAIEQETHGAHSPATAVGSLGDVGPGANVKVGPDIHHHHYHGPPTPNPPRPMPPTRIRMGHSEGLEISGNYIDTEQPRLSGVEIEYLKDTHVSENTVRAAVPARTGSPLAFVGYESLRDGTVFLPVPYNHLSITAVYIKNTQVSPAKALRNVRARIEYLHDGVPDFVVDRACWWARYPKAVSNADTIDLDANEEQALPVLMQSTAKEGMADYVLKMPQSAAFGEWRTRNLGPGRWTLRIAVSADFYEASKGEIEFTVLKNHLLETFHVETRSPYGSTRLPVENPIW